MKIMRFLLALLPILIALLASFSFIRDALFWSHGGFVFFVGLFCFIYFVFHTVIIFCKNKKVILLFTNIFLYEIICIFVSNNLTEYFLYLGLRWSFIEVFLLFNTPIYLIYIMF